jgi:two-component system NtrC family sensor kinase
MPLKELAMEGFTAQLLCALIGNIHLGIIVLDRNLRIQYWNQFVSERCATPLEQACGRPLVDVFPEANSAEFSHSIELARDKGRHVYNHWLEMPPLQLQTAGSEPNLLALQSTLLFPFTTADATGYFGLVVYDTSAVTQGNEQLRAALKALGSKQSEQDQLLRKLETANSQLLQSEKMAAIGQLAAGVAHEINNPIGYVFSNLKTLDGYVRDLLKIADAVDTAGDLDELRQLKRQLEYDYIRGDVAALISESEDGIDRVTRIISALKDFSHIDEEEFRPADLHRGLDTTLNVVNNELKYKAEVIKEYGELPEVECILSQINQVVMNLLVNAAHAMEQFGRITLRTGCDSDWAWIEVEDNGKGIEPKLLNRIFEPFFTTKPVGKGTGLGLALSYNIVQKHSGNIEVYSEPNIGTRFRINLPIRQVNARPQPDVAQP